MRKRWRQWRDRFYVGPRDLGIEPYRRKGYQSPTLTAALWGYALVVRHFTLTGRLLLMVAGILLPYAMISLYMPIHMLAFAVLGLLGLDLLVGFVATPRLEVERQAPTRLGAGGLVQLEYTVRNPSRRLALDVRLDTLPLPHGLRFPNGSAYLDVLAAGESVRARVPLIADLRGRYVLPAVRADSAFPFHLWRWGTTGGSAQVLLVYPRFTPLARLDLPVGQRYQPGGISLSSKVGESMEFLGCREFRDGDNPRHLHWRSWARTGSPVVKEFREEYLCRAALVVDTFCKTDQFDWPWLGLPAHYPAFEGVVSLAAAVADFLARQDYIVDLFAAGPQIYRFQGGRSLAYLENILDILACLQPHPKEPFADLAPSLVEETSRISAALVLLLTWNDARRELLEAMTAAGVSVRAILVSDKDPAPAAAPGVTVLRAADILAGRAVTI